MLHLTVELEPLVLDNFEYDATHDVLYLYPGQAHLGEEDHPTPEGHVVCYSAETGQLATVVIIEPRKALEREGRVAITIPDAVDGKLELTRSQLAPVLEGA